MPHLNVAEAGSSSTRAKGMRLTKEGSTFLTNYARIITAYPNKVEKESILASIRTLAGNEACTLQKLTNWFTRYRTTTADPHPPVLVDDETILFPRLSPLHLQQLRVLYKKRTDPSEGILTFWATRINADRAEVAAWIQYQQEKAKQHDACATPESPEISSRQLIGDRDTDSTSASVSPTVTEFPRPHLPTPAKSPSISPQTRMPSLPPIAVKVEEPRPCLSPVSSLGTPSLFKPRPAEHTYLSELRSPLDGLPPLSRLVQQMASPLVVTTVPNTLLRVGEQAHRRDPNEELAACIRDSLRPPDAAPSESPPTTADEFTAKFERVENMIETFMETYDSGRLARLGWDSSLSRVPS